ncbi:MAG: tRNA1(Val) (adenine(37)-N6)-methyltransferase [bacterium]
MQKINLRPGETIESLGENQLKIIQDKKSYRFSLDSILLAQFVNTKNREKIIDLGTGSGIIPLMIYNSNKNNKIYAVEIQQKLADIAQRNIVLNHLENQVHVIHDDMKNLKNQFCNESFDVIITNPPYIPAGKGKLSATDEQLLARHEINMNLETMMSICSYLLKKRGRLYLVHRADSLIPVIMILKKYLLEPKTLKFVYTKKNNNAKRFLIEASKDGGTELKVLAPLFLNQ